jgi:hypothetical protein
VKHFKLYLLAFLIVIAIIVQNCYDRPKPRSKPVAKAVAPLQLHIEHGDSATVARAFAVMRANYPSIFQKNRSSIIKTVGRESEVSKHIYRYERFGWEREVGFTIEIANRSDVPYSIAGHTLYVNCGTGAAPGFEILKGPLPQDDSRLVSNHFVAVAGMDFIE